MSNQPCRYCGIKITRWEKLPDGKYLRYDENGLHKYDICKAEQLKRHKTSYQPNNQVQLGQPSTSKSQISNYIASSSTFPVDKEPEIRGVTINSLFVKTSNMEKEIKELRKQIETLASIADSIAQKTELVIQKIGYPEPKPAVELSQERAREEIEEANNKLIQKIRAEQKTDESGVLLKDGQEIKAVQRHPTQEELVNSFKLPPTPGPTPKLNMTNEQIKGLEEKAMNEQIIDNNNITSWQTLSEAFLCHNCEGKFHNGFYKLGTRLCPACKDKIESNESEDRSDVNNFNPNPPSSTGTVEDMMNEDL